MTRSIWIAGAASVAAAVGAGRVDASPVDRRGAIGAALRRSDTLAADAAEAGILFGTAAYLRDMSTKGSTYDPAYDAIVLRECSLLFPGFGMGADATRKSSSGFDFSLVDPLLDIASTNDLAFAGGHLVWHQSIPPWVPSTLTFRSDVLKEMLLEVTSTVSHFAGKIEYWTVVNEVIDIGRNPEGLRNSFWLQKLGPDYIAQAFMAAHDADPRATLVLNEHLIEGDRPGQEPRRAAVLGLLRSLREKNVPVDALGLQAHLFGGMPVDQAVLDRFLNDVHDLGLKVLITELDVVDVALPADIGARDAAVAKTIQAFLEVVLRHPAVTSINTWGLSDNHSWYNSTQTPAALRRSDGLSSRGTLLDASLHRKPAYYAVRSELRSAAH
jgi:endo-1,4-beta-xylanase